MMRPGPAGARGSLRPRRRLLGGQQRLPGARPTAPRARAQPRPAEHVRGDGPLPSLVGPFRPLAGRGRPSERAFLEAFFLTIYTPRAHNDGTVEQIIDEVLAFPHKQATEDLQRFIDAFVEHDATDRLPDITAPTLVLAGGRDIQIARSSAAPSPSSSPAPASRSWRRRPTSPSRRCRTNGTPASTPSGARSRPKAEVTGAQREKRLRHG